jgi:cysteine desulfurase / selenocysteine lyase
VVKESPARPAERRGDRSASEPLFDRADFHLEPGLVHLCGAGETPFLRRHSEAFETYAHDKSLGVEGREREYDKVTATRKRVAGFFGVPFEDIGVVSTVAEGMTTVAATIDWNAGENACVLAIEFASMTLPLSLRRHPPVELRVANDVEELIGKVDAKTRVISVSQVSYWSSERVDLEALRRAADRVGALLLVDFTHSAGAIPIDLTVADFGFSACYKWLLGCTGVAVAYWNRERQPGWSPGTGGWNSIILSEMPDAANPGTTKEGAARFTFGNPAFPAVYVLEEAIKYLEGFGIEAIYAHNQQLVQRFIDGLDERALPLLTPRDFERRGSSVSVHMAEPDHVRGEQAHFTTTPGLVHRLQSRGILTWGGQQRLRVSFHGYNSWWDVDQILAALDEEWRG